MAKALLVDDRRDNLIALEAILQGLPVQTVAVESGEAALKQLLVDDFAVILLDAQMPDMDGFETASHIKRRERTRHVPIIFLTAADRDAQLALRGYAAGAVDYLTKPFDPWVLRAKVSVFVELWTKTRQLAAQSDLVRERDGAAARPLTDAVDEATALLTAGSTAAAETGRAPAGEGPLADACERARAVAGRLAVADHQRAAEAGDVQDAEQEVADVGQHQQALRMAGLAAEHDQGAEALRVAEGDAAQVEHDPRRRVGQHLIDGGRQLGGREHVDLTGEAKHGFVAGPVHRDGQFGTIHPVSLARSRPPGLSSATRSRPGRRRGAGDPARPRVSVPTVAAGPALTQWAAS